MASTESAQQSALHFVVPTFAVVLTCAAPILVLLPLKSPRARLADEARAAVRRPISLLSFVVIGLSPVFLLSNYSKSGLYLYAVYSVLLASANLLVERLGRRRAWPFLLIWHFFNLLNLLGASASFLQPYKVGGDGIILTVFTVSSTIGDPCPSNSFQEDWCDDGWLTFQMLIAFGYVIIHIALFFLVAARTLTLYGGLEEAPEVQESLADSTLAEAAPAENGGGVPF
mmetsp:Transcript_35690/g.64716  ORF Transcript_35690/g.64716 Transcript_35690/m.64716 type:complete len:228 (-) Transcript_35690:151-834(-)